MGILLKNIRAVRSQFLAIVSPSPVGLLPTILENFEALLCEGYRVWKLRFFSKYLPPPS